MQPALVIISISINNANLSLRGIILGNDLESESRCALSVPLASGWERFVRAERRLHRASRRLLDRSTIDRSRTARMDPRAPNPLGDSYRARSYSSKVCRNLPGNFFPPSSGDCSVFVLLIRTCTFELFISPRCFNVLSRIPDLILSSLPERCFPQFNRITHARLLPARLDRTGVFPRGSLFQHVDISSTRMQ